MTMTFKTYWQQPLSVKAVQTKQSHATPAPREKSFLSFLGVGGGGFCKLKLLGSTRGKQIEDRPLNPDKKGEEVTEKLAGLSEELMNTPPPFRGIPRARSRPGSTEQEVGAREQRGRPWAVLWKIWGTGYQGAKGMKGHLLSPVS